MSQNQTIDDKINALATRNGDINKQLISGLEVVDANAVHITGDETISGVKTFTCSFNDDYKNSGIIIRNSEVTRGINPSVTQYWTIVMCDDAHSEFSSDGNHGRIGAVQTILRPNGDVMTDLYTYKNEIPNNVVESLGICYPSNAAPYAHCPTPSLTSDNTTKIATTAWVNNADCVVHKSGAEDITGMKTFKSVLTNRSNSYGFIIRNPNLTRGTNPSGTQYFTMSMCDNNGLEWSTDGNHGRFTTLETYVNKSGTVALTLCAFKNTLGVNDNAVLSINCLTTGDPAVDPGSNGTTLLGRSSYRWKEIWCTQSSINSSSDERIKSNIINVPDELLEAWENIQYSLYHFKDSVSEKGEENSRLHSGLIAQRIAKALTDKGLDPEKYGFYLYDQWDAVEEEKDEEGNIIQKAKPAGDAYGLRYNEVLCIEAAYLRKKNKELKDEVQDLKERIKVLENIVLKK